MDFRTLLFLLLWLPASLSTAQRPDPDRISTGNGDIVIQPILHGTLVLEWNGHTIYVDPYGGAEAFQGVASPDLILITDIHGDHLDEKTLDALPETTARIIAPQAVFDQMSQKYKDRTVILSNGGQREESGIGVKAIPMYNLPEEADSKHVKGRGNGYILQIADKTVYISGDTEDIPEMRALKNIDVAFICMNLPYTMDIEQAADAVLEFKPAIVYPYHYRGRPDMSDTEAFRKLVNKEDEKIEVRLRNWYPDYQTN